MKEIYENEKKAGMYMVVVNTMQPLTFDDKHSYKLTSDTYSQLVRVTDSELFNKYLQDLCKTPGAKVSYYFLSKLEDILEL